MRGKVKKGWSLEELLKSRNPKDVAPLRLMFLLAPAVIKTNLNKGKEKRQQEGQAKRKEEIMCNPKISPSPFSLVSLLGL